MFLNKTQREIVANALESMVDGLHDTRCDLEHDEPERVEDHVAHTEQVERLYLVFNSHAWEPASAWVEHPEWPRYEWHLEVANDSTVLDYHDWVRDQIALVS